MAMERDQLEKLTKEYQVLQEQLQSLAIQREQFKAQREELKEALEEIEKSKGKIYLSIGGVMVETDKESAKSSIKEKQESNSMRYSIVEKQYEDFSKKELALRAEITNALKDLKQ